MKKVNINNISCGKLYMIKHEHQQDDICIFRCSEFYLNGTTYPIIFYALNGLYVPNGIWCSDKTEILRKGEVIYEVSEEEFESLWKCSTEDIYNMIKQL